jgi:hypothetical protein
VAACTLEDGVADTGGTPNSSNAFSPASGDLLIVFAQAAATTQDPATLVSSIGGFTFTQVAQRTYGTSRSVYAFVADALVSNTASQTVEFDVAADPATGTVIFVYAVSGMSKFGTTAIRQSAENNAALTITPSVTFPGVCLTGNPTLAILGNITTPAGITPNASWTEPVGGDLGYSNPDAGAAVCHRDSGFTSDVITWGADSATAWGIIAVELDASAPAGGTATARRLPLMGVA